MLRGLALVSLVVLTTCVSAKQQREDRARAAMLPVIQRVVFEETELRPVIPVSECVVDNASDEEKLRLVSAALQGVSGRDSQMVLKMVRRPEVRACAFAAGVTDL